MRGTPAKIQMAADELSAGIRIAVTDDQHATTVVTRIGEHLLECRRIAACLIRDHVRTPAWNERHVAGP